MCRVDDGDDSSSHDAPDVGGDRREAFDDASDRPDRVDRGDERCITRPGDDRAWNGCRGVGRLAREAEHAANGERLRRGGHGDGVDGESGDGDVKEPADRAYGRGDASDARRASDDDARIRD